MYTNGYLGYLLLSSLFTLGACRKHDITLRNLSGTIPDELILNKNDDYEWKFSPELDGNQYKLRIIIANANCKDELKIKGELYCNVTTPLTLTYASEKKSSNCYGTCTESQPCSKYDKKFKISYNKHKGNSGYQFSLDYQFISCTKTTPSPTTSVAVSTSKSPMKQSDDPTSVVSSSRNTTPSPTKLVILSTVEPSVKSSDDATSVSPPPNTTEPFPKDTTTRIFTPPSDAYTRLLISIVVPVVIILAIAGVVLVVIIRMRRSKSKVQSSAVKNHSDATGESGISFPNDADVGVYEPIDDHAQSTRTTFANQAHQSTLSPKGGDSYAVVDDGSVYYSAVAEDESQNGANRLPAHAYEEVALDVEVNEYDHIVRDAPNKPHNYNEVTLEVGGKSTEEALEIANVLYEDTKNNI